GTVTATLTGTPGTPGPEPNLANNVATVVSTIRGVADVTLALAAAPNPVLVSGNLIYTVGITNKGANAVTSLTMTDALPASVTFVAAAILSSTNTQGACFTNDIGQL